jgi:hypothetical protein
LALALEAEVSLGDAAYPAERHIRGWVPELTTRG